jgi:lipopolysaccharide biosynthesis protein
VVIERGDSPEDRHDFQLAEHVVRRRPLRTAAAAPAREEEDVKVLAIYLPQFHPIPENDRWWGKGFTEWSRVARARPQFVGHYQPHLPERLGFYDLRLPEVRARQAALARAYGIHGFCYYYYWFGTKTLLERPLTEMLATGEPDFPFCLCWANENWTRRWDGAEGQLLIEQRYGPELDAALIQDLMPFFRDHRYLRVRGAPVLLVYQPSALPEPLATTARWRRAAREQGLPDLHLVAALTFGLRDPRPLGFDAAVEFPPHGEPWNSCAVDGIEPGFSGAIVDFRTVVSRRLALPPPPFRLYRTAMAGWDNTPRRGRQATVFHRASPGVYEEWLRALVTAARRVDPDHRLVFVNAWNEWAEGAHLEPDKRFGTGYLEATRRALTS